MALACVAALVSACATPVEPSGGAAPAPRDKFGDPAEFEIRTRPVTIDDATILRRATALLADDAAWNRHDDRDCRDDEATGRRSLFCALQKASIDVLGTYDHRRVALQEVRFAVEDATRGMELEHRLMDFNNLARTDLAGVHRVLQVAAERVQARLRSATK